MIKVLKKQPKKTSELSERERKILGLIVRNFVIMAKPVSSRQLCKRYNLGISPATVRNVMMELEEKGYITQPHVSAGRIPTDKGYRFYVDMLMRPRKLSEREQLMILEDLMEANRDVRALLERASQVLAKLSQQLGVVMVPHLHEGIFEKLDLVPISETRTLAIISVRSGLVKSILLELDFQISPQELESTARIINERLHGLTFREIRRTLEARLRDVSEGDPQLLQFFIRSSNLLFDFEMWKDLYFRGTRNIFQQPEFYDRRRLEGLVGLLEDKPLMVRVLDELSEEKRLNIVIGGENREERMRFCSVVTASYRMGSVRGAVAIIGPTRMQYPKVVTLVDHMSKVLERFLN